MNKWLIVGSLALSMSCLNSAHAIDPVTTGIAAGAAAKAATAGAAAGAACGCQSTCWCRWWIWSG